MAKRNKTGAMAMSCTDCIHEWACSMQCGGNPMSPANATRCACYEDVKGSTAYFIGFMDGKRSMQDGDKEN